MAMIKLTKHDTYSESIIYINTDYIQSVREHPNVRRGLVPTVIDMMNGETRYQVKENVQEVLKLIREGEPFYEIRKT